jgi:RNA-directed DNA polymerase
MKETNLVDTTEGTPQGGIISPVLCNIALNGIEPEVKKAFPLRKGISPGVHLIRYADDMVITGRTEQMLKEAKRIIETFLEKRGLQLNQKKTRITHITNGFDFLGFNIRRMRRRLKYNELDDQNTVLIIKPSKKSIAQFKDKVRNIVKRTSPFIRILKDINPVIRG